MGNLVRGLVCFVVIVGSVLFVLAVDATEASLSCTELRRVTLSFGGCCRSWRFAVVGGIEVDATPGAT